MKHTRGKKLPVSSSFRDSLGNELGWEVRAVEKVGLYVPGGKASYPSTVLMTVIPAKVAGVKEISIVTPCPNGEINPTVLAAASICGVDKIYRVGGAQAIAALAYGTGSVGKVDKVVGPGNIYVTIAKKLVFGAVDIVTRMQPLSLSELFRFLISMSLSTIALKHLSASGTFIRKKLASLGYTFIFSILFSPVNNLSLSPTTFL